MCTFMMRGRGDPSRDARILAPGLDALATYDDRPLRAATDAGLATVSPRDGTETT
jgi:hypothetical protein